VVAWADKFRVEATAAQSRPRSWAYDIIRRTRLLKEIVARAVWVRDLLPRIPVEFTHHRFGTRFVSLHSTQFAKIADWFWLGLVLAATVWSLWTIVVYVGTSLGPKDVSEAAGAGLLTMLRVLVLIAVASLIWVPIGVWIGLRPWAAEWVQPLAQFLAAFPANVLFPFFVVGIAAWQLNPNIWLSPLMVLGTQWYILFNVIAGAKAFPTDLQETAALYRLGTWQWWRQVILPGIFPYYVTGALTASGGSWNASIVAEVASWGDTKLEAIGLGAYIAKATEAGDYHRVVLGIAVMSFFVLIFNRILWRRLYAYAERKLRLD